MTDRYVTRIPLGAPEEDGLASAVTQIAMRAMQQRLAWMEAVLAAQLGARERRLLAWAAGTPLQPFARLWVLWVRGLQVTRQPFQCACPQHQGHILQERITLYRHGQPLTRREFSVALESAALHDTRIN